MRSMTGFGQAQLENDGLRVATTVRTVNHRHLDLVVRLPDELRPLEARIAACLRAELKRGRVDARLELSYLRERPCEVEIAHGAVAALHRAAAELASEGLDSSLGVADLMRLPEVMRLSFATFAWTDEDCDLVLDAVAGARDQAVAARAHEGERLAEILSGHLDDLAALHGQVSDRGPEARQRLEEGFRRRLDELLTGGVLSEDRLAQEIALLVERSDVQEELDRLAAHLEHARRLLTRDEPVGRRLEFLSQELLREVNTLGSKSRDLPILELVLDAKSACDRLREQVLNVE